MPSDTRRLESRAAQYVYGPVPSRRLGRSLGIDLVPFKTCCYDCIYCQLGPTTEKTLRVAEYAPVDTLLNELREKLRVGPRPDYIGLAGSGEPTLHGRLGALIAGVKSLTDVPVAVLTNGALLWRSDVRASLAEADRVMPSLDAGNPASFAVVNRPHEALSFERMVDGLLSFSHAFAGELWLEVLLVGGITDDPKEVRCIADIVRRMRVDRIQLNTVSRPAANTAARAVAAADLARLGELFSGRCEVIAEAPPLSAGPAFGGVETEARIVALLDRRPCTVEGIAAGLGLCPNEVLKHLTGLCSQGLVNGRRERGTVFYEGVRDRSGSAEPL